MPEINFRLKPRAPFRLHLTVWALRRRPNNAIDLWDGRFYRRIFSLHGVPVQISVRQTRPPDKPQLEVTAISEQRHPFRLKNELTAMLERILGLQIDLSGFYEMASDDPKIGALVRRFTGFRPPRFPTVFEALVNAIACQQRTVLVGIMLLNSLARTRNMAFGEGPAAAFAFPAPEDLGRARPETLGTLGFSRQKATTLIRLGRECAGGASHFDALAKLDDREAVTRLLELHGIGRWSAEYTMLRSTCSRLTTSLDKRTCIASSTLGRVQPMKERAGCCHVSILTKVCFISTFSLPSWTHAASSRSRPTE